MFSLRRNGKSQRESQATVHRKGEASSEESIAEQAEEAIEVVAKVLRILGRHAWDLDHINAESIDKQFESWARHVLLGTPLSGATEAQVQETVSKKDWGGMCQFVNRQRQHEKEYVVRGFQDLREVIWTFTKTLSQAFLQDKDTDAQMQAHISRLKTAVGGRSPEDIKREVLAAAEGLSRLVEDRSHQQRRRLAMLGEKLKEVETELGQARKQMAVDSLTQLYNRAALDQQLERVSALSLFSGTPSSLIMVDIDHFKAINDTHGHRAGDGVIRELANRTVLAFPRKSDFVARYGGEEFAVVLQGDDLATAKMRAERLLAAVRQSAFQLDNLAILVTTSIGLAQLLPGEAPGHWVERADQALYAAKTGGRNQLCVAAPPRKAQTAL